MEAFWHSLSAVALILMMIGVGFIAGKTGLMKSAHKSFLVKYLINIAVPAMCIANVFGQFESIDISSPLLLFLPPLLSMLITLVMALLAVKLFGLPAKRRGAFIVMCAFSNSMFIGLPMCRELFGETALPYVIIYYIVNTLLFWTIGAALIQRSGDTDITAKRSPLTVIKRLMTPPLLALLIAAALMLTGFKLPHILTEFCGYLGDTVSPLALMYVGFVIYETGFKRESFSWSFAFAMFMRFLIAPAISLALCYILKTPAIATKVYTIEAAMPVMTQCVIVSAASGADEEYAASAMTISTLLCLVAIPALMAIMDALSI